jgi:proteasome lid subunit RPN8/RPN11
MPLKLTRQHFESIRTHGSRDYPNECCGILLGRSSNQEKEITEVVPLRNLRHEPDRAQAILPVDSPAVESERNRFLIDPTDQIRVEKDSRARGLQVVGYYHSHPDHPARPSNYDRDHAWPWYSYVIISVQQGTAGELNSWVLRDDRSSFDLEPVEVMNP